MSASISRYSFLYSLYTFKNCFYTPKTTACKVGFCFPIFHWNLYRFCVDDLWGLVAVGILGDEPVFESPELARAALLAVASAGPEALGVFNVWGIAGGAQAPPPGAVPVEARWRAWARVLAQALAAG